MNRFTHTFGFASAQPAAPPMTKPLPKDFDFLVIGAGIAGLRAAIELAPAGTVLVLAKNELTESATQYAQGGIAVALSDEDEIGLHLQDTLVAGDGLCNVEAARVLVEEGPERIQELIDWGTQFDRSGITLTFTREGAHSRSRVLHAHGDSTGREIGRTLYAKAATLSNISFSEFEFTANLILHGQRARGAELLGPDGQLHAVGAAVLLATGGLGQIYRETTNPGVATGDGVAMAYRCGAEVSDMEFVQFHPTALYVPGAPRFLLSEALRGEGAYLRNMEMHRFMPKHHPMAELAPRDVVSRAIAHELEISAAKDPVVYLDMTHLDPAHLRQRFPRIYSTCMQYNIDIGTDLVPVRPAAHYAMGGVRTDLDGRTSIAGLYAAGETACTGVHGANRLASNSLLEGLVFGARAGHAMREHAGHAPRQLAEQRLAATENIPPASAGRAAEGDATEAAISGIRDLMWRNAGIVRNRTGMTAAIAELQHILSSMPPPITRRAFEARNMAEVALLIARSALARRESRGAHYRTDYPLHDDARFKKHSIVQGDNIRFE
jgi:L-aspartate oxidase